jgi:ATP-dependent helicase IRC3
VPTLANNPKATQTLILVHRRELVDQAYKHCRTAYPNKTIEIEMGKNHASGVADITIASVQSLTSKDRMLKFDPTLFKLVLVDEAHHIVAPKYLKTLSHFGLATKGEISEDAPILIGVSATFSRFDGLKLGAAIDKIVYHRDYVDMIGEKWLSDVVFTTVQSKVDISKVKLGNTGDFQLGSLSRAVNTSQTNEITVRSWLDRARGRKSTLVFCVDISHVHSLTMAFRRHGTDARYITSGTPKAERDSLLDSFKKGEFPVLLNCGIFTEGTDIPNIDCVLLARPTRSRNLLVQMIGRGMRLHPQKENCHIIDMVANLSQGIVSTPTLFGLDPSEILNEEGMSSIKAIQHQQQQPHELFSRPIFPEDALRLRMTDYESVNDLIADTSTDRHIRSLSQLAWVRVGPEKFILTCGMAGFLTISRLDADIWVVKETLRLHAQGAKSPFMRPRELASADTFEGIVHASDTYATESFPRKLVAANEGWRRTPASDGQVSFLNRFRDSEEHLSSETLTRGQAADMITKIRHGAKGEFERIEGVKKKVERQAEKIEKLAELRRREEVRVGDLL